MFFLQLLLCQTHSHPINFSSMSTPQRAFPCYLGTHPAPCNLAVSCLLLRIWLVVLEVSDSTCCYFISLCFQSVISSVQLFSHVQFFMTLWTAECQASLSITNSRSLLKLMPIESVMPSNQSNGHDAIIIDNDLDDDDRSSIGQAFAMCQTLSVSQCFAYINSFNPYNNLITIHILQIRNSKA